MNAIVTARIPVEIKEQGAAILKEIDSTPTELINAAYSYLLRTHSLPKTYIEFSSSPMRQSAEGKRVVEVTKGMREAVNKTVRRWDEHCTVEATKDFWDELDGRDYKDYIAEMRASDYETLA